MKTLFIKSLFIAVAFLSCSLTALPQGQTENDLPVDFMVVSKNHGSPLFQLRFNNEENNQYHVIITDSDGEILHSGNVSRKKVSRKYRINFESEELYESLDL